MIVICLHIWYLMLLMRGYTLKNVYSISKSTIYKTGIFLYLLIHITNECCVHVHDFDPDKKSSLVQYMILATSLIFLDFSFRTSFQRPSLIMVFHYCCSPSPNMYFTTQPVWNSFLVFNTRFDYHLTNLVNSTWFSAIMPEIIIQIRWSSIGKTIQSIL